jgi:hypothetical protein
MANLNFVQMKEEKDRCSKDPAYFICKYITVTHPVKGRIPFELYNFQRKILDAIQGNRFNLLRKFRQAGCTTLMCAYTLWYIIFHKNKTVMVVSIGDRESTLFLDRVKEMYNGLPNFLKPQTLVENKHDIRLSTGSKIRAQPAGAGRSESVSFLVVDEAAFIEDLPKFWKAVFPTISTGGNAILLSTVNGMSNLYYELWRDAKLNKNSFNAIQIHWREHPEYNTPEWEKTMRDNLGPRAWRQEIECEFLGTGETFIDSDNLTKISSNISPDFQESYHRRLRTWESPKVNTLYILSIDPAFGVGQNKTAFHIFNLYTGEQVAEFYSNETKTKDLIPIIYALGNEYNQALVACERNSLGMIIIQDLFERYEYENMYTDIEDGELGIPVYNTKSRDALLEALEESIYNNKILIRSSRLFEELGSFVITDTGKIEADEGYNDDLVIACGIACHIRNKLIESGMIEPNFSTNKADNTDFNTVFSSKYIDKDIEDYNKWILS